MVANDDEVEGGSTQELFFFSREGAFKLSKPGVFGLRPSLLTANLGNKDLSPPVKEAAKCI